MIGSGRAAAEARRRALPAPQGMAMLAGVTRSRPPMPARPVILLLSFLMAAPAVAQPSTVAQSNTDARAAQVDALFAPWDTPDSPGAVVAVVENGEVVLARGYGRATLEYDVPITPQTVFHVASVSKQFTTFAIALLADQGRLSLDDDVRTHLLEVPDFGHPITLRHLVHHTSGLRDQWELLITAGWRIDDVITQEHILSMVRHQRELNFEPGAEYLYSNTGYTLLAEVVARVTAESFGAWMQRNVFGPLGMTSTHFHDDHERIVPGRAYSYAVRPDGTYRHAVLSYANAGATSLFTTAEDLARWVLNLETGTLGGSNVQAQMRQRGVLNDGEVIPYAFALIHGEHRDEPMLQHGGADAGYRSYLAYFPERRLGVVVLSNLGAFNPGGMALRVADVFLGAEPEPEVPAPEPVAVTIGPERLGDYAGSYALATGGRFDVSTDGTRLRVRLGGSEHVAVTPVGEGRFHVPTSGAILRFERGEGGRVEGAALELPGRQIPARRLMPLSAAALAEYEGVYHSDELGTAFTIAVRDGHLVAEHRRHAPATLAASGEDRFLGDRWGMGTVAFTRDAEGRVDGFLLTGSRVRNLRFERLPSR
jgi:CubicO group peptidase (beta-lactamase class C family)